MAQNLEAIAEKEKFKQKAIDERKKHFIGRAWFKYELKNYPNYQSSIGNVGEFDEAAREILGNPEEEICPNADLEKIYCNRMKKSLNYTKDSKGNIILNKICRRTPDCFNNCYRIKIIS